MNDEAASPASSDAGSGARDGPGRLPLLVGFALAYLLCLEVGQSIVPGSKLLATFWPVSGLYLAALLLTQRSRWPLLVLGAALAHVAAEVLLRGRAPTVAAAFWAAGTAEALTGAWLLTRAREAGRWRLNSVRSGLSLFVFGGLLAPMVGAAIGAPAVGMALGRSIETAWPLWWAADAVGVVLVAPALLALAGLVDDHRSGSGRSPGQLIVARGGEAFALGASLCGTGWLVVASPVDVPMVYFFLPSMLWAAMRFGVSGGALVSLGIALLLELLTRASLGPFAALPWGQQSLVLQTLLAAYAATSLLVALLFLERRRAESSLEAHVLDRTRALSASEERYRTIVEMSNEGIFVMLDGRIVYSNAAFLRLVGASDAGEVLGTDPLRFVSPEFRESVRPRIERVIRTGLPNPPLEQRFIRLDGKEIVVETSAALYDANGVRGLQVLARDISERKRVEWTLWKSQERMKLALRAARMYVFEYDVRSRKMIRSTEAAEVVGLPSNLLSPVTEHLRHVHPDDRASHWKAVHGLSARGDVYSSKYRFLHPQGGTLTLEEFGRGMFDERGELVAIVGITVDVSDREATLSRLKASEERFATLANAVPAILMTATADGRCDYVNPAFIAYTGMAPGDALGEGWLRPIDEQDRPTVRLAWYDAIRHKHTFAAEYRLCSRNRPVRWFKSLAVPVRDPAGEVTQWIAVALDVEDHKRSEAELQAADRRKDEFLAMLAHELRNPLAPIRNAGALLLRKIDAQHGLRPAVEMIERQSTHLSRLVDELLDVSRVTRGKITLDIREVDLRTALRNGVEAALPSIERRRQRLETTLPPVSVALQVDVVRFAQVVANLLDNASKFSDDHAPITLDAAIDGAAVVIRVSDRGQGIPTDLLPGVFDLFTQAPGSLDRSAGGLGIGLALVQALVEMHGGSVEAASDGPGRGACFTVRLPLAISPGSTGDATSGHDLSVAAN